MTKQEFTTRTMVEVSNDEFDAINVVYMNSELDKDEFCKVWIKMNAKRVKNAKVERMIRAKDEAYRSALHKFFNKTREQDLWTPICYVKISVYEIKAMSHAGIQFENECGSGVKNLFDIRHEIAKYLGMY